MLWAGAGQDWTGSTTLLTPFASYFFFILICVDPDPIWIQPPNPLPLNSVVELFHFDPAQAPAIQDADSSSVVQHNT